MGRVSKIKCSASNPFAPRYEDYRGLEKRVLKKVARIHESETKVLAPDRPKGNRDDDCTPHRWPGYRGTPQRGGHTRYVGTLKERVSITPGLAVVLVGDDPASHVYVKNKVAQTIAAGMVSIEHRLRRDTSETELLSLPMW
ncbi:tetrahydrofolate dehydrogenase/cyclohydrolase catalytic domain-containing protein [Ensifer sp. BR816]|uniref:tetrahydrofolate dehydrogenase/cyclohydrolase catalytic domain-containing protein n=1 Tax=Rhizobium sp. (strain BR816) TaxID=1057002 RepID=UPI000A03F1C7|nr:tetrahydrofolate dehydrogenase/cyclohydrolase catalytic domain-containing protein [Ensifer sp. BR816]